MGPPTDPRPSGGARELEWSVRPGRTKNSRGPRAIGDHGALCPCPNSKKPMKKKRYQGHLMGPPTGPGPRAVPEFPNGQSAPA
ncbi:unnamed protein product, partial [Staurois parvus]